MCTYLDWELTIDDRARFHGESTKLPKLPYHFRFEAHPLHRRITIKHPFDEKSNTTNPVPGSDPSKVFVHPLYKCQATRAPQRKHGQIQTPPSMPPRLLSPIHPPSLQHLLQP